MSGGRDRIEALYAWVADGPDGEGIVGRRAPDGRWYPLVVRDEGLARRLEPTARRIGAEAGAEVRLIRVDRRTTLRTCRPPADGRPSDDPRDDHGYSDGGSS